jgi:septum site-determining protein MinC
MPIDGSANERNTVTPNGVGSDRVRAKLTALLDDITVTGETTAEMPTPTAGDEKAPTPTPNEPEKAVTPVNPEVAQVAAQIRSIQAGSVKPPKDDAEKPAKAAVYLGPGQVTIKGRSEGVTIEIGKGLWADLVEELRERLAQSGTFFRGGSVALEVGVRPLLENELDEVRRLLEQSGLMLGVVRTGAERTFESALSLGLAARLTASGESDAEVELAGSNQGFARYFIFRGNLRSGQILERKEHILVIGDVNPGAEVVSQGDIMVWGRMRGIAHAGADGDLRSVVLALQLDPIQLRIAGTVAIDLTQNGRTTGRRPWKAGDKRPEVAFVANDQIVIEPWDESKPGGLAAFRR